MKHKLTLLITFFIVSSIESKEQSQGEYNYVINADLPGGIYNVSLTIGNKIVNKKVIINQ